MRVCRRMGRASMTEFDFQFSDNEQPTVEGAVFQALGYASLCWSETPKGVFDDTAARDVGDKLLEFIKAHPQQLTTAAPCQVHKGHSPPSHVNEVHHVWPVGDGGPNIAANRVVVCATGHNSIHQLIDLYRKGNIDWDVLRHYSPEERRLAILGWDRIRRQAM